MLALISYRHEGLEHLVFVLGSSNAVATWEESRPSGGHRKVWGWQKTQRRLAIVWFLKTSTASKRQADRPKQTLPQSDEKSMS